MTRQARSRHVGPLLLLVVAIGLVATACGGDEGLEVGVDEGLEVGVAAPGFSLADSAGGTVALDEYQDQAVLLYFHMADG